jgi:hypothetical protein
MAGREGALLGEFMLACDRAGLRVPFHDPALLMPLTWTVEGWPEPKVREALALAQHHGVPTRLLDWTRRAKHAAYFAAAGAAELRDKPDYIEIWALNLRWLDCFDPHSRPFDIVMAPASSNPRLHAQAGLFTLSRDHTRPLDKVVRTHRPRMLIADGAAPEAFRRYRLPLSEAGALLRLLRFEGISGASMLLGYDGVVKELRERAISRGFDEDEW